MDDFTLPLPGLSPIAGRPVKACFDGGSLSSDAGVLVLREVEGRLGVAKRLARCLDDPRDPALITHSLADTIRFRMLMIAAGYEDGNDAASLRQDPVFKMAQGIAPSGRHLALQLRFSAEMCLPSLRLVGTSPAGPRDDPCRFNLLEGKPHNDAPDLLH